MWTLSAEYATGSRHEYAFPTKMRRLQVKRAITHVARLSGVPVSFEEGCA